MPSRIPCTRAAAALILALAAFGCGIGEKVMDPCNGIRASYEMSTRKMTGLRGRGLPSTHPNYRLTSEELKRAREAVARCEVEYGIS